MRMIEFHADEQVTSLLAHTQHFKNATLGLAESRQKEEGLK